MYYKISFIYSFYAMKLNSAKYVTTELTSAGSYTDSQHALITIRGKASFASFYVYSNVLTE